MESSTSDKAFVGSVPKVYASHLVPLLFEPYASDLVARLASRRLERVLEVAAGTGAVTRALAASLPAGVSVVATDLNQAMLDEAAIAATVRAVEWRQADALELPFDDGSFDAVVCQFGVMFFPDKPRAFSEARRVLRAGGMYLFNVWDQLEENEFADVVTSALASMFPSDPPRFLARTPYGYHDRAAVARDLLAGGFTAPPRFDTVSYRSAAESARSVAVAYCQGTPLRAELEARGPSAVAEGTLVAEEAIAARFGRDRVEGKIQAHVIAVER